MWTHFPQCMQLFQSFKMIEMLKKSFINIEDNNWSEKKSFAINSALIPKIRKIRYMNSQKQI
jgi:hypothetical protein